MRPPHGPDPSRCGEHAAPQDEERRSTFLMVRRRACAVSNHEARVRLQGLQV
jgi:hypothetical protein